jgi:hypothetical protein
MEKPVEKMSHQFLVGHDGRNRIARDSDDGPVFKSSKEGGLSGHHGDPVGKDLSGLFNDRSGVVFRTCGGTCDNKDQVNLLMIGKKGFSDFLEIVFDNGMSDRFPSIP